MEYKATFGFNDVATFKKALTVYKAILEAQVRSVQLTNLLIMLNTKEFAVLSKK